MPRPQLEFRSALPADVERYVSLGESAQHWLRDKGLAQYVPAAHTDNLPEIRRRVECGSLFRVSLQDQAVAFFSLESTLSKWWPEDGVRALYLAGMVVSPEVRGQKIGREIIAWCVEEARGRGCSALRLDYYMGNPWLCAYYQSNGFKLRGEIEQHPGYFGCLYQRDVCG